MAWRGEGALSTGQAVGGGGGAVSPRSAAPAAICQPPRHTHNGACLKADLSVDIH